MFNNINKDILAKHDDEALSIVYKKVLISYILEVYFKKNKENNIDIFPKTIFGDSKINSIEDYIMNFEGTRNESLLDYIFEAEKTKLNFLNSINNRNQYFEKWIDNTKQYVSYQTELNYDNSEQFLTLFKNCLYTIQKNIEVLATTQQFERNNLFKEHGQELCYGLVEGLLYQLQYTPENIATYEPSIHLHSEISEQSNVVLLTNKNKTILIDEKEKSLSNRLFGKEEPTSEERFEYGLKKILVMYFSQILQILNNNTSIQYQKNKNRENMEKISSYIDSVCKLQEAKIMNFFNEEDNEKIILKEQTMLRQLVIKNIEFYNKKIEITDMKELGKYF